MKNKILKISLMLFMFFIITGCFGCGSKVSLFYEKTNITMKIDETKNLAPEVVKGKNVKDFTLTYVVEGDSIVVDNDGNVTAIEEGVSKLIVTGNDKNNTSITITINVEENSNATPTYFTVTFDSNGGNNINGQLVEKGQLVTKPINPTREGYQFVGWLLNGEIYNFNTPVVSNIILVADWKLSGTISSKFTVIFDSNGGSTVNNQIVERGQLVTQPANPTREGYKFTGWLLNGEDYNFNTPVEDNIVLVASWEQAQGIVITYNVIFDSKGGNSLDTQIVESGQLATQPNDPIKEGAKFAGWLLNGEEYDFSTPVLDDITLIASWKELEYRLTYDEKAYEVVGIGTYDEPELVIPSVYNGKNVTWICSYAFEDCNTLISVTIPSGIVNIGSYAFKNCSNLTNVTIPSDIDSIGSYVFQNCNNLEYTIYDNAKYLGNEDNLHLVLIEAKDNNITNCIVNEGTKIIMYAAFASCNSIASITIPFIGNKLNGDENTHFGYIFGASSRGNHRYDIPSSLKEVIVTGDTKVEYSAFYDCINLTHISIPEGVTSIGSGAFEYCDSLIDLSIPDSVTSIGSGAFEGCSSLTKITIPESVTEIEEEVFRGCSSLTNINIPNGVTSIGEHAFQGCGIAGINIPEGVTSIGEMAFAYCGALTYVIIPSNEINIGSNLFFYCDEVDIYYNGTIEEWCNLKYDSYESNPMEYAERFYMKNKDGAFYELSELVIPDTVTSIGDYQFSNCKSLIKVTIPGSVTSIGKYAFSSDNITSVIILEGVKSIGQSAFANCDLETITIPGSITKMESDIFYNVYRFEVYYNGTIENWCNIKFSNSASNPMTHGDVFYMLNSDNEYYKVTSITIPNTIATIGDYQFYYYEALKTIIIPNSVTSIGAYAFYGCTKISEVYFLGSYTEWQNITFYNQSSDPTYYADNFYVDSLE